MRNSQPEGGTRVGAVGTALRERFIDGFTIRFDDFDGPCDRLFVGANVPSVTCSDRNKKKLNCN